MSGTQSPDKSVAHPRQLCSLDGLARLMELAVTIEGTRRDGLPGINRKLPDRADADAIAIAVVHRYGGKVGAEVVTLPPGSRTVDDKPAVCELKVTYRRISEEGPPHAQKAAAYVVRHRPPNPRHLPPYGENPEGR